MLNRLAFVRPAVVVRVVQPTSSTTFIPPRDDAVLSNSVRYFSKYLSKSATKRLPLTTKRVGKGFYKGKGCRSEGRHTSKGKFLMDRSKMLELVVPDLNGFKLKPYIAASISKYPPEERRPVASRK